MTEDQAKTKWCPFVRFTLDVDPPNDHREFTRINNRDTGVGASLREARCMGSECMAWRWTDPKDVAQKDRRGCCGLAGRP